MRRLQSLQAASEGWVSARLVDEVRDRYIAIAAQHAFDRERLRRTGRWPHRHSRA
jgi:hypothetical protein